MKLALRFAAVIVPLVLLEGVSRTAPAEGHAPGSLAALSIIAFGAIAMASAVLTCGAALSRLFRSSPPPVTISEKMMTKDVSMTVKLDAELRRQFMDQARQLDRPASQVLRELMRDFIRHQPQRGGALYHHRAELR